MDSARTLSRQPHSSSSSSHYPPTPISLTTAAAPPLAPPPPPPPAATTATAQQHYAGPSPSHHYPPPYHHHHQQQPYQQHTPSSATPTHPSFAHSPTEHRASYPGSAPLYTQALTPSGPHSRSPYYNSGNSLPPIVSRDAATEASGNHSQHTTIAPAPSQPVEHHGYRPSSSTRRSPLHGQVKELGEAQQAPPPRSGHATPSSAHARQPEPAMRNTTPIHAHSYQGMMGPDPSRTPVQPLMDQSQQHYHHPQAQHGPPHPPPPLMTNGMHPPHAVHHDMPPSYAPTPIMEHQQAPPYPASMPPGAGPMYHPTFGPATFPQGPGAQVNKRKPMRAQQACEQCRQRKQKCDEGNPCQFCREQNIECQYRDPGPAKIDKTAEKVLVKIDSIAEQVEKHAQNLDKMLEMQQRITDRVLALEQSSYAPANHVDTKQDIVESPVATTRRNNASRDADSKLDWEQHRTGAHNLLLWPSVRPLFAKMTEYNSSYVKEAEERGVLRVNGKGQGIDSQDYTGLLPAPASPAPSDDSHESSPTPREGIWGRGPAGSTPPVDGVKSFGTAGGLNPDGTLDISTQTVNTLFESFMKRMYIMHPFLERKKTKRMVDLFINNYSPNAVRPKPGFVGTARLEDGESDRPMKRSRSNEQGTGRATMSSSDRVNKPPLQIEHSPANAIVLMILALGKICQWSEPLPGVPGDKSSTTQGSNTMAGSLNPTSSPVPVRFGPTHFSPRSNSAPQQTPPDILRTGSRSRRQSFDNAIHPTQKNVEFIPGLAYFAKGAEIMSGHIDGSDLMHAHMFLLAALYKGQLARVKEAAKWLLLAGNICYGLIDRSKLYKPKVTLTTQELFDKIEAILADKRSKAVLIAASSCLQLESDILAEMSYPASAIQQIEATMLPPHNMNDEEDEYNALEEKSGANPADYREDIRVHTYYTAQLYLRRRLNNVHNFLYGEALRDAPLARVREILQSQQKEIADWRASLPAELAWNDDDAPASNILDARLRAKWYGASYVIHRPFLDYALHIMPRLKGLDVSALESIAEDADGHKRGEVDIALFKAMASMDEGTIWAAAQQCIAAAFSSTVALDGACSNGRLIVTNIHGTAHAQFGNMLVLAATHNVSYLKGLVDPEKLQRSLERTISFLRKLSGISPTCAIDCSILEQIQNQLFTPTEVAKTFQNEREPVSATTSFST